MNKKYQTKLSKSNNLTCASEVWISFESETLLDHMLVINSEKTLQNLIFTNFLGSWNHL